MDMNLVMQALGDERLGGLACAVGGIQRVGHDSATEQKQ